MSGWMRFWLRPAAREARNEQTKLRGALINAVAIALMIAALAGPFLNPDLAMTLDAASRIIMGGAGLAAHLAARFAVRGMEDK